MLASGGRLLTLGVVVGLAFFAVPAHAWVARVNGTVPGDGVALATAIDGGGDVVVGGYTSGGASLADFTVVKLAGTTGAEVWRRVLVGPGDLDAAAAVAVDATSNDVVATGITSGAAAQFTVVKLAASTGAVLWRREIAGDVSSGRGAAVAVDQAGDVVAVGTTNGAQLTVVKLARSTGAEIWRAVLAGEASRPPGSLAVTGSGDVVVAGFAPFSMPNDPRFEQWLVLKLAGSDGTEMWRYAEPIERSFVSPPHAVFVALDQGGDVVAAGPNVPVGTIVRLAAADGAASWSQRSLSGGFLPTALVVGGGDVFVLGVTLTTFHGILHAQDTALVALGPADGAQRWTAIQHTGNALALVPPDDVALAGSRVPDPDPIDTSLRFATVRLAGQDGSQKWRRGDDGSRIPGPFDARSVAVGADGLVVSGSFGGGEAAVFGVLRFADDTGALDVCGDGVRDRADRCDDGNTDDADCCTTDCRTAAPGGTRCDDANACTVDDACRDGVCTAGGPLPCEPCGTCDIRLGCIATPADGCRAPTATERAALEMRRGRSRRGDALAWLWGSGDATAKADFGNPRASSGYALCIYADFRPPLSILQAPPGGRCGKRPCWKATARGFEYRDPAKSPSGISRLSLRAGRAGRARIRVHGEGVRLGVPPLPLQLETHVTVQLKRTDSAICWGADESFVVRNRPGRFTARGN